MSRINCYSNWNKRTTDIKKQIDPYRKYIFVCEGKNTECWYFKRLIDLKKELDIHPLIDVQLMEKPEGEENNSNPKKLIEFADSLRKEPEMKFDRKNDRIIIVFDVDIFKHDSKGKEEFQKLLDDRKENIFAVTNPSFELFLLLHYDDAYNKYIKCKKKEIFENKKVTKKRKFIDKYFSSVSGMNPKENPKIGNLAENVKNAIKEEKNLNQNIDLALNKITSNVGKIIQEIIDDRT